MESSKDVGAGHPPSGGEPERRSPWTRAADRLKAFTTHPVVAGVLVTVLGAVVLAWLNLDSGGGGPTPTESTGPAVLADFDVQVEVDPAEVEAGPGEPFFYWLPEDVRSLEPPPDDCRDRRDWAYGNGGADADAVWARLTIENNRDRQVRIDDMRIVIDEEKATPGGTVAACPVGGASSEPFGLLVDFAEDPPALRFRESQAEEFGPVPGFELAPGEQDSFAIYVRGRAERLISWRLRADVSSAGKSQKFQFPPDGEDSLRIAGTGGLPMFRWTDSQTWEPWVP